MGKWEGNEMAKRDMARSAEPVTEFPGDLGEREPEVEDIERCVVSGMYLEYAGARLLTYLPAGAHNGSPQLIVIPPAAADARVFLRQSGIMELADRKQFFVHVLWADGSAWDIERAGAWGKDVIACVNARKRYVGCAGAVYLLPDRSGSHGGVRGNGLCGDGLRGRGVYGGDRRGWGHGDGREGRGEGRSRSRTAAPRLALGVTRERVAGAGDGILERAQRPVCSDGCACGRNVGLPASL